MQPSFILPILHCAEHLFLSIFQPVSRRRGRYRRRSFANIRLDCKYARGWKAIIDQENEGRNEKYREEKQREREREGKRQIFYFLSFSLSFIVRRSHFLRKRHSKRAYIVCFSLVRIHIQASTTTTTIEPFMLFFLSSFFPFVRLVVIESSYEVHILSSFM